MTITKIEEFGKTKYKVYIDGEFAFALNKGELSHYHLKEDSLINEDTYDALYKRVLKRGKLRALHLLNDMGRTESQLRDKLLRGGYEDSIVDEILSYVRSFGYIDDFKYANNYIASRKSSKSKRQIQAELLKKGISSNIISDALDENYQEDDVHQAIENILKKRHFDSTIDDEKDIQKHLSYLARKGFSYGDIRYVILDRFHKSV